MKIFFFVFACVVLGVTSQQREQRQIGPLGYLLPSGVEILAGPIRGSFSCEGRIYGYYADVDTNCKIFHVCSPEYNHLGEQVKINHYSFGCANLTVFDQRYLTCVHDQDLLEDNFGCEQSTNFYDTVNSKFFITDRPT